MNSEVFKPVRGTEATILATIPQKGYVYFATDTRKIFYSDGESFLSMGGNSGIYYGSLTFDEPPDSDIVDFTFSINDIEGDHAPNENDLILNIPDGCFYRVNSIESIDNDIFIYTTKLTIAGSGGGGGAGSGITLRTKNNLNSSVIYCVDGEDAIVSFNVSSTAPDDSIKQIIYRIGPNGSIDSFIDDNGYDMGDIEFNLKPYISKLSTATSTSLDIVIVDAYGVLKTIYYSLNRVSISLREDSNISTILLAQNHILSYVCTPIGGGNLLNKKLIYTIYDNNKNLLLTQEKSFNSAGTTQEITINLENVDNIGIGTYYIEIKYIGYTTATAEKPVESNILSHSIISYSEEPLLIAYLSQDTIEQYSNLYISYMVGTSNTALLDTKVTLIQNDTSLVLTINYNTLYTWKIYLDTPGIYDFTLLSEQGQIINFKDFIVTKYEGNIPVIDNTLGSLKLNLTTVNRNNNDINRNIWTDRGFTTVFENFVWEELNGWLQDEDEVDMLRLSSGAKITIDNSENSFFTTDAMNNRGYTIELDFKISGVTDFSLPLISCVSKQTAGLNIGQIKVGFLLTGQTSTLNTSNILTATGEILEIENENDNTILEYNTLIQGLTAKFIENERIHLSWVIEAKTNQHPMIKTYLNGILSGITEYNSADNMIENPNDKAKLIINSNYGIIDIYNIRVYNTALEARTILENYIATIGNIDDRVKKANDNFGLLDTENKISTISIEGGTYSLNVPYIKFTGGRSLTKDDNGYKLNEEDQTSHLPRAKKDYRLVDTFDFIDPTGIHENRHLNSSFKSDGYLNGVAIYGQGTSSMEYPIKNLRVKFKMKDENGKKVKFLVNNNDYPVDILTLKADYMESSSSHNTGTANLVFNLLEANNLHTPGLDYYNEKNPDYKVLTAIRGYPIICFFRTDENQPFEYIGRYNLNIDKSSEDVFGFLPDPSEKPEQVTSNTFGWKNASETYTNSSDNIVNSIHCYEFLNNASALDNFLNPNLEQSFEESFYLKDTKEIPEWFKSFEARYPEGEAKDGSDVDITSWFELCKWVNSTAITEVPNSPEDLIPPVTYNGVTYNKDNAEYRLAKFKNEFTEHFNLNFVTFYYILTHTLLMIDSRAKNMMMATWDNLHWYPIFYDMDTMLGLNNYGYNKYDYNVEDTAPNVYNGQNSVLWNNFRECFLTEIRTMYNNLQKSSLNYSGLLRNYNDILADAWNEMLYNQDAQYKYINPFISGYYDGLSGEPVWVNAGTKNYLYASQGSRSMHRKYWIQNRLNYLNGKYLSDLYKDDKFIMRLYTPDEEEDNFYPVYDITAEDFLEKNYYIKNNEEEYEIANSYSSNTLYYEKADNRLNISVLSVPPNNNFKLTPLYNLYLSVAFGGDNGVTSGPYYVSANTEKIIEAPSGSKYNDTETYIYGGSMLKDLGDLSTQYLGSFVFPSKTTKLEKLVLGNLHKNYYNPNFSSLSIGESAPYLKELNIINCSGLKTSLNLSKCLNLNKIFATGSLLKNVIFAEHGILSEVRLPNTLNTLILKDLPFLTTENFTIGTYDFDNSQYSTSDFSNLNFVHIEKTPLLDTYPIAFLSSQILNNQSGSLEDFAFIDIDWEIPNSNNDITSNSITVLENLLRKDTNNNYILRPIKNSFGNSLTGTIHLPANNLQSVATNYLNIYQKYISVFPHLQFDFLMPNRIHWVKVYDGNNKLYWSLPILNGTNSTINSNEDIFDSAYGVYHNEGQTAETLGENYQKFVIPTKASTPEYKYIFSGKWLVNGEEKTSLSNLSITSDLEIYPIFNEEKMLYKLSFYNGNEEITSKMCEYGTRIIDELPIEIPRKNDDNLNIYQTYTFLGYNTSSLQTEPLDFTNQIVNSEKKFYAIFSNAVDVNNSSNINYEYFNFITYNYTDPEDSSFNETGYLITPKTGLKLSGKITIPKEYNGKKVLSIANFGNNSNESTRLNKITGIFFEEGTNIRNFANYAFANMSSLKYLEIPDSLRTINDYAVYGVRLKLLNKNLLKTDTIYYIGSDTSNLYSIGQYGFTNCIDEDCTILYITGNLLKVSSYESAFMNFNSADNLRIINIGNPNYGSILNLQDGHKPFRMNAKATSSPPLTNINIYLSAERYHSFTNEDKNWLFPYSGPTDNFDVQAIQTNI